MRVRRGYCSSFGSDTVELHCITGICGFPIVCLKSGRSMVDVAALLCFGQSLIRNVMRPELFPHEFALSPQPSP